MESTLNIAPVETIATHPFGLKEAVDGEFRSEPPETPETPIQPVVSSSTPFNVKSALIDSAVGMDLSFESTNDFSKLPRIELVEMAADDAASTSVYTSTERVPVNHFTSNTLVELSRYSWCGSRRDQRYLKGCLWSPDGTCLLAVVNGDGMHVTELPHDLYSIETVDAERPVDVLQSVVHVPEGGVVYDFCWYPQMKSSDIASSW